MKTTTKAKTNPQWEPTGDTFITRCDVKGCSYDFHQYAIHSDLNSNRLLVTDMDGNEEFETDSYLECTTDPRVMCDYLRHVTESGNDYLGVLSVPVQHRQTWVVTLANWLGNSTRGMMIVRGRRVGRKAILPVQFPTAVREYLEMSQDHAVATTKAVHSLVELEQLQESGGYRIIRRSRTHFRIRFSLDVPFTPKQSKRAVMKAARAALRRLVATSQIRE